MAQVVTGCRRRRRSADRLRAGQTGPDRRFAQSSTPAPAGCLELAAQDMEGRGCWRCAPPPCWCRPVAGRLDPDDLLDPGIPLLVSGVGAQGRRRGVHLAGRARAPRTPTCRTWPSPSRCSDGVAAQTGSGLAIDLAARPERRARDAALALLMLHLAERRTPEHPIVCSSWSADACPGPGDAGGGDGGHGRSPPSADLPFRVLRQNGGGNSLYAGISPVTLDHAVDIAFIPDLSWSTFPGRSCGCQRIWMRVAGPSRHAWRPRC